MNILTRDFESMWLETKKAPNFNAVVWVLGEVNGYLISASLFGLETEPLLGSHIFATTADPIRFERTTSAFRHERRARHIIGTKTLGTKALRIADPYAMVLGVAGPVAQLDRALPSEGRGRTFESYRVRQHFQGLSLDQS